VEPVSRFSRRPAADSLLTVACVRPTVVSSPATRPAPCTATISTAADYNSDGIRIPRLRPARHVVRRWLGRVSATEPAFFTCTAWPVTFIAALHPGLQWEQRGTQFTSSIHADLSEGHRAFGATASFDALQPMPAGLNATPLTLVEFAAHDIGMK
jgi:hypothetical protein